MRVLRSSLYARGVFPPLTTVVRDHDTIDTLESIRAGLTDVACAGKALVVFDIFTMEEADILGATAEGIRRQQANAEQEGHMAMLYYWTTMTWERIKPRGVVFMDKPAPLSREEITAVFEQLAARDDYRDFRITTHTRDGEPVELVDGQVLPSDGS